MQNYLAQFGAWVTVDQGVIFVVCVLAFRRGMSASRVAWLKKPLCGLAATYTRETRERRRASRT